LRRDPPPSREEKKETPGITTNRLVAFGEYSTDGTASTIKARDYKDATDLIVIDRAAFNQGTNALYQPYIESTDTMPTLISKGPHAVFHNMAIRRLTPVECERLQGFPDNYTRIKEKCPDGPRYKAMGNSMAVPVMRWIGKRIMENNV
jgi:DNA (cytosine-5)-methyltransferase 1